MRFNTPLFNDVFAQANEKAGGDYQYAFDLLPDEEKMKLLFDLEMMEQFKKESHYSYLIFSFFNSEKFFNSKEMRTSNG